MYVSLESASNIPTYAVVNKERSSPSNDDTTYSEPQERSQTLAQTPTSSEAQELPQTGLQVPTDISTEPSYVNTVTGSQFENNKLRRDDNEYFEDCTKFRRPDIPAKIATSGNKADSTIEDLSDNTNELTDNDVYEGAEEIRNEMQIKMEDNGNREKACDEMIFEDNALYDTG